MRKLLHKLGIHNYKIVFETSMTKYYECTICGKRTYKQYGCGYQPIDHDWINYKQNKPLTYNHIGDVITSVRKLLTLITLALLLASCEKETITKEVVIEQPTSVETKHIVKVTYNRFERKFEMKVNDTVKVVDDRDGGYMSVVISCENKQVKDTVKGTWFLTLDNQLNAKRVK